MLRKLGAITIALVVLMVTPAIAAPGSITGTIDLAGAEARTAAAHSMSYGDTAHFATSVDGKINSRARVYVSVFCTQGDTVVYQWSADPDFAFPLVDQDGQGLEWNGEAASCEAWLVYRVKKGKGYDITYLDMVPFEVAGS